METLEINSSQALTRQYQLASLDERFFAFIIDLVIMMTFCSALFYWMRTYFQAEDEIHYVYMICLPVFLAYTLVFETLNKGRTIGKYCLKLRVIKADGAAGTFSDYLTRWLFRSLDLYLSLGTFAIIMVTLTDHNQRLGDLIANTVVVKQA